ncbi:MAG: hypothetical protein M3277_11425 [Actinomycetota bacterium]|nr:hypothetical protein [Actinomycetota bacterium]
MTTRKDGGGGGAARISWYPKSAADLFVLCSAIGWILWALLRPVCHPFMDLTCGNYTDHFSHMNTARLFTEVGIEVWQRPLDEFGRRLTMNELKALPSHVRAAAKDGARAIPGWPIDKPFISSWANNPRFHPPGFLALVAPVAIVYHTTDLSLTGANRLLIASFLGYAHISLFIFFRAIKRLGPSLIGLLGAVMVYGEVIHFSLEGFYEAAIIGPLILSAFALRRRDGLAAVGWFTLAAFLHFRALFFLPLVLYGGWLIFRNKEWRRWRTRSWAIAIGSVVAGALTLGVFALLWPHLHEIRVNNPVHFGRLFDRADIAVLYLGMFVFLGVILIRARSWFDLGILTWSFFMFTQLRETFPWDVASLLAWIGMPIAASRAILARDARLLAIMFVALFVFDYASLPNPIWIIQLF